MNELSATSEPGVTHTDEKEAFSVEEFCRRYPIGKTRLYDEINRGNLQAKKLGRRTVIPAESARAWLRELPDLKPRRPAGFPR